MTTKPTASRKGKSTRKPNPSLTAQERRLREVYTTINEFHGRVTLIIDHQEFAFNSDGRSLEQKEWLRDQIAIALARLVDKERKQYYAIG